MKLTVERLPESQVRLDIVADDTEFNTALDRAYRSVGKGITVPGFRKGKAPRVMIERYYGRGLFVEEAHKEVIDALYRQALTQESLIPVAQPEVEITAIEPVGFTVTVPVYPEVDLGDYTGVRVEPRDAAIDGAEVDTVIDRLRLTRSPWADPAEPRSPRDGDQVTLDIAVTDAGEPFQAPVEGATFVLGESNLFEGLLEQVREMHTGEERTFDIVFEDDDESVDELVRGKTLTYVVTLQALKEREPLALDDDFAKEVGDAESVDDLRRQVRDDLHQAKTRELRTLVVNEVTEAITGVATVDPPATMIEESLDEDVNRLRMRLSQEQVPLETYLRSNRQSLEEMRAEMRPDSARRLRSSLVIRAVAEREHIVISDADIAAEIDRLSEGAAEPERLREIYAGEYFQRVMRNNLFEQRLGDRLIELATGGRGATVNGWEAPVGDAEAPGGVSDATGVLPGSEDGTSTVSEDERITAMAEDAVITTGTMSGQPGDIAATASVPDPDAAVSVAEVADEGRASDVEQAAAVGHETESDAVGTATAGSDDAAGDSLGSDDGQTPEERESLGEPSTGGSLPNPTY
ncbi:MAG: trigger factor [Chloroflexota bacterium]|nr:trigger factor [Chloroflexota bacterium]